MIIKKFNIFLEKVVLVKSSGSGATKQKNTILDEPSDSKSLSSLLLLNNELKKQEYIQLLKKISSDIDNKFINNLLNSGYSDEHIRNVILAINNYLFIRDKQKKLGNLECEYCGKSLIKKDFKLIDIINLKTPKTDKFITATCDHKQPKSKGGDPFDYSNLAVCCRSCNSIKSDMSYEDWKYIMKISDDIIKELNLTKEIQNIKNLITKSSIFTEIKNNSFKEAIITFITNKIYN